MQLMRGARSEGVELITDNHSTGVPRLVSLVCAVWALCVECRFKQLHIFHYNLTRKVRERRKTDERLFNCKLNISRVVSDASYSRLSYGGMNVKSESKFLTSFMKSPTRAYLTFSQPFSSCRGQGM